MLRSFPRLNFVSSAPYYCSLDKMCYNSYPVLTSFHLYLINHYYSTDKMRYDPQLWRRVFEDQKQVQAKKGRQLDPYYKWQF